MHKDRVTLHHSTPFKETQDYVLYWMQQSQRIEYNYALSEAVRVANKHHKPLKVLFVLTPSFKDANLRHYTFMLEGLYELVEPMQTLNIDFILELGSFDEIIPNYLNKACSFIMDKGYLKPLRMVRQSIIKQATSLNINTVEIESDLIVPIHKASHKCEYAARTIRPKLLKQVDTYLDSFKIEKVTASFKPTTSLFNNPLEDVLNKLNCDESVKKSPYFKGGYLKARKRLEYFLTHQLSHYPESNDPSKDYVSKLSPYLHFGQISALEIYKAVEAYIDQYPVAVESYLEQLLVRRELAFNFVYYCEGYDQFKQMTDDWAYETMQIHLEDSRDYLYTETDYITFKTHDIYFNAAMKEMVKTGFMHNYMRMYWGKKIIEWSPNYEEAYNTILTLNNRYFIDGRDPNSYTGVAWLFGRHDRAWQTNKVVGKLRYMNANGLKRKFDIDHYVKQMDKL